MLSELSTFLIENIPLFIAWSLGALVLFSLSIKSTQEILWRIRLSQLFLWSLPLMLILPEFSLSPLQTIPSITISPSFFVTGEPQEITSISGINFTLLFLAGIGLFALILMLRDVVSYWNLSRKLSSISSRLDSTSIPGSKHRMAEIYVHSDEHLPPMTFGFLSKRVYVAESMTTDKENLELVLDHELSHVQNNDFVISFIERQFANLFWFIPTIRLFIEHLNYLRELRCDMNVVSNRNPKNYAQLLLSVVEVNKNQTFVPAFASSYNHLKKRITMLTIERDTTYSGILKLVALFSGLFMMLIACDQMVELGDGVELDASAVKMEMTDSVYVEVDTPPSMIGGLASLGKLVEYPKDATKEGVEGRVMVTFVVDENGIPTDIKSPSNSEIKGERLTKSEADPRLVVAALEAASKIRFTPAVHQGKTVKMQFALPIVFRLPKEDVPSGK